MTKKLSRRSFLRSLGVTAAAGALAACQPKDADQSCDQSCDFAPNQEVVKALPLRPFWQMGGQNAGGEVATVVERDADNIGYDFLLNDDGKWLEVTEKKMARAMRQELERTFLSFEPDAIVTVAKKDDTEDRVPCAGWCGMQGRVWYVDPENGNDDNSGESIDKALATHKAAIARSSSNDTVLVWDGCPDWIIIERDLKRHIL